MGTRIGIVEDHREFRQGLTFLLEGIPGYEVAWSCASAEEASQQIKPADVILLDINLPGLSGIDSIPLLRKSMPDARIIMLTILEEPGYILQAIMAGADGYILKKVHPHKIPESIQHVLEGGAVLTPDVARQVFNHFRGVAAPANETAELTSREKEILALLVDGHINEQIAEKLFISQQTVRSHIKNIYSKLQVHNRAEVVARALRENLLHS